MGQAITDIARICGFHEPECGLVMTLQNDQSIVRPHVTEKLVMRAEADHLPYEGDV